MVKIEHEIPVVLLAQICLHIYCLFDTYLHDSYATFKCKVSANETTLQTVSYSKQEPDQGQPQSPCSPQITQSPHHTPADVLNHPYVLPRHVPFPRVDIGRRYVSFVH